MGFIAFSSVNPFGFGKLCQDHCAWVISGTSGEYCSGKVCSPVMSAVKAKLPLPTMKGADLSTAVTVGLWRVTSAWRSMGFGAAAAVATAAVSASKQPSALRACMAAKYAAKLAARARP